MSKSKDTLLCEQSVSEEFDLSLIIGGTHPHQDSGYTSDVLRFYWGGGLFSCTKNTSTSVRFTRGVSGRPYRNEFSTSDSTIRDPQDERSEDWNFLSPTHPTPDTPPTRCLPFTFFFQGQSFGKIEEMVSGSHQCNDVRAVGWTWRVGPYCLPSSLPVTGPQSMVPGFGSDFVPSDYEIRWYVPPLDYLWYHITKSLNSDVGGPLEQFRV